MKTTAISHRVGAKQPKAKAKADKQKVGKGKGAAGSRPYNRYNLYFILERERLVLSKGGRTKWSLAAAASFGGQPSGSYTGGYGDLELPPLPPRFAHLPHVPADWCVPGRQERRPHRKTHGVASFRDLARDIAISWKAVDDETREWCAEVETILKQRYEELKRSNFLYNGNVLIEGDKPVAEKTSPGVVAKPSQLSGANAIRTASLEITKSNPAAMPSAMSMQDQIDTSAPPPIVPHGGEGDFLLDLTEDNHMFREVNISDAGQNNGNAFAPLMASLRNQSSQPVVRRVSIPPAVTSSFFDFGHNARACLDSSHHGQIASSQAIDAPGQNGCIGMSPPLGNTSIKVASSKFGNDVVSDEEIMRMWISAD